MKEVYVLTKAKPMKEERLVDVFSSLKALETHLKKNVSQYIKKDDKPFGDYTSYTDGRNGDITLYFAHKKIVKD
ncbi:MAG: hypothetical protein M0P49_02080 [Bacilli bacterium]|nr:hypothetical protein [Bacilli bacterium]